MAFDDELNRFLGALGAQESGGRYEAEGPQTKHGKARGKYQILPSNWPRWAKEAGLPADAPMTPANQELVARHKLTQYYRAAGGDWRRVAYAWYSGRLDPNPDKKPSVGPTPRAYADSVLRRMGQVVPTSTAREPLPVREPVAVEPPDLDGATRTFAQVAAGYLNVSPEVIQAGAMEFANRIIEQVRPRQVDPPAVPELPSGLGDVLSNLDSMVRRGCVMAEPDYSRSPVGQFLETGKPTGVIRRGGKEAEQAQMDRRLAELEARKIKEASTRQRAKLKARQSEYERFISWLQRAGVGPEFYARLPRGQRQVLFESWRMGKDPTRAARDVSTTDLSAKPITKWEEKFLDQWKWFDALAGPKGQPKVAGATAGAAAAGVVPKATPEEIAALEAARRRAPGVSVGGAPPWTPPAPPAAAPAPESGGAATPATAAGGGGGAPGESPLTMVGALWAWQQATGQWPPSQQEFDQSLAQAGGSQARLEQALKARR